MTHSDTCDNSFLPHSRTWLDSFTYMTLIAGNPPLQETPPSGGVSYLLCSLIKNPEEEDPPRSTWYKFFEGGTLPPGSWLGNIANRNPPRGGFSAINLIQSRLIQMCGTWLVRDSLHAFMCPHRWDLNHSWLVASIRDSLHSFVTRCMHSCVLISYKVPKMHRMPQIAGLFPQKSHQL